MDNISENGSKVKNSARSWSQAFETRAGFAPALTVLQTVL